MSGAYSSPGSVRDTYGLRRLMDLVAMRIGPATAAGLIAWEHGTGLVGAGRIATGVLIASFLVAHATTRLPLHLMRLSSIVSAILVPPLGLLLATGAGVHLMSVVLIDVLAILFGAWLLLGLGAWVRMRFEQAGVVRVAVIGDRTLAAALAAELRARRIDSREIAGWIDPRDAGAAPTDDAGRHPESCLGGLDGLRRIVLDAGVDLLVDGSDGDGNERVTAAIADQCLDLPVRMVSASQFYEEQLGHVPLGAIDSAWFRYMMHPRFRAAPPLAKRVLDMAVSLAVAPVVVPLGLLGAAAVKLGDGGSVLYRQRRIGEAGREFEILKLRTMTEGAGGGAQRWSCAGDGRVTPVGRFLRRTHLDELPQLWNVLCGEMSLVGPRPEQPGIVADLEHRISYYDRRHLVRPGITGWAQVSCGYSGSTGGTAWKLCHDLYYLKHRSIAFDLLVMIETLRTTIADVQFDLRMPDERFLASEQGNVPSA